MKRFSRLLSIIALVLALALSLTSCAELESFLNGILGSNEPPSVEGLDNIPEFDGTPYVIINENKPYFKEDELVTKSYESFAELDNLKRCGVTMACIGRDIMPTEERDGIGMVKPSGWQTIKYDCVNGKYLYNRCHLIGFQLTGENANEKNLITGTRFMNVDGMLPFENMVADYVKETNNHVMYRVTPIFSGNNLVANGVLMEAFSVEDNGDGICFCVYVYNNQPGVRINYTDGTSKLDDGVPFPEGDVTLPGGATANNDGKDSEGNEIVEESFVINTSTEKYHKPDCTYAKGSNNTENYTGDRTALEDSGYEACKVCKP